MQARTGIIGLQVRPRSATAHVPVPARQQTFIIPCLAKRYSQPRMYYIILLRISLAEAVVNFRHFLEEGPEKLYVFLHKLTNSFYHSDGRKL